MAFINLQLDISDLPSADEIVFEAMSPDYPREVRTQMFIIFIPAILASFLPAILAQLKFLLVIPVFVGLVGLLVGTLVVRMTRVKGVALREHDIAYQSGLFWRKTVILAYNRMQHVEVGSGPLQRRYGLATLKFFTAGGSAVDLKVDGLARERADQIRAFILKKVGEIKQG